jgi:ankyrin repeat protein
VADIEEYVNRPNLVNWKILNIAVNNGHDDVVKVLLENKADIDHIDKNGNTALIYAIRDHDENIVKTLLENKADANHNALSDAIIEGDVNITTLLVEHKANINHVYAKRNNTSLMTAVYFSGKGGKDGHIVKKLLEMKANINIIDDAGNTALTTAASRGNENVVKILLESKPAINHTNKEGNSALVIAAAYGQINIVKLLLKNNAIIPENSEERVKKCLAMINKPFTSKSQQILEAERCLDLIKKSQVSEPDPFLFLENTQSKNENKEEQKKTIQLIDAPKIRFFNQEHLLLANQAAHHALWGNPDQFVAIVNQNPDVLLCSVEIKDPRNIVVKGKLYELLLWTDDAYIKNEQETTFIEMVRELLIKYHGVRVEKEQRARQFRGWDEKLEIKADRAAFDEVSRAFDESTAKTNDELAKDDKLQAAIIKFKNYLKSKEKVEYGKNCIPQLWDYSGEFYDYQKYEAYGAFDSPKNNLFCREILGTIDTCLPPWAMQVLARGIYYVKNQHALIPRIDVSSYYAIPDSSSSSDLCLGVNCFMSKFGYQDSDPVVARWPESPRTASFNRIKEIKPRCELIVESSQKRLL